MARDPSQPGRATAGTDASTRNGDVDPERLDPAAYLERIGVDPVTVETPDLATLAGIQRAHVTSVAFENLAIVGDPYGDRGGEGVVLSTSHLYEKIVGGGRGGFCFELNGLLHWLLDELGYDVDRVAARVVGSDGDARPPANHHSNVVDLDQRYVVDAGMGTPTMRRPTPLDGSAREDDIGVTWRVVESDRPDETYRTEYRRPGDEEWSTRYVFSDIPRGLRYFDATCDYLQSAPESTFTGDPIVSVATDDGHRKLSVETVTEWTTAGDTVTERTVTGDEWHATLGEQFGIEYDRE